MTKLDLSWAKEIELRPGTMDDYILREIERSYGKLEISDTDIVLDIGACFGAFSIFALKRGARLVIAYEPDPDNYDQLATNSQRLDVTLSSKLWTINKAVTRLGYSTFLWRSTGKNKGTHSTIEKRGRKAIAVESDDFDRVMSRYGPTVIKIDCEGCEHELLERHDMYPCVKQVAVEFDMNRKSFRSSFKKIVDPKLGTFKESNGWRVVVQPLDTGVNWNALGVWRRD